MAAMTTFSKNLLVSNKWIILSLLSTAGNTIEDLSGVPLLTAAAVITFPYMILCMLNNHSLATSITISLC